MKITIKCYRNEKTIFEGEYESTKHALIDAVSKGVDLQGADLRGADLRGADLRGAYLQGVDLQGAYLRGADLRGADLRLAYLQRADLQGADLQGAYLRGVDLRGVDLQGVDLRGVDLRGEKLKICPILMQLERWDVIITHGFMQIGCERHTHTEWNKFNRPTISKMADGAWNWWKEHKDMLMLACDIQVKQSAKIKDELDTKEEGK